MSTSIVPRPSPYTTLKAARKQIRLLTIHPESLEGKISCSLEVESLKDRPHYQAISYTWGPAPAQTPFIYLNDIAHPVRPNLLMVLRTLRARHQVHPIWVDALCINQENTEEREQQVGIMGEIYRDSWKVIAWLGEPDAITDWAMRSNGSNVPELVPNISPVSAAIRELTKINISKYRQHLEKQTYALRLLKLEYWNRLWIIQEIVLAGRLVLLLGSDLIEWQHAKTVLVSIRRSGMSWILPEICKRVHRIFRLDFIMTPDPSLRVRPRVPSISFLLDVSQDSQCEDPRDKIFGILAIATSAAREQIPIDYSISLFEVYGNVIRFFLSSNDTDSYYDYDSDELIKFSQLLQRSLLGPDFAPSCVGANGSRTP